MTTLLAFLAMSTTPHVQPPLPVGAVPSQRQLKWHELEVYGFVHFTTNTFTDKEWGYGDESVNIFAPTHYDPDQIVTSMKAGGMKGIILTAKHHDGFCLWPTKTTAHSVKSSRWKDGRGDVVRDFANACRRHGLKFGVYVSPWDRNHPTYGTPEYPDVYRAQLTELLTQYGPIFEVWHDGANGGDGYYGGARETRKIDPTTYYDWPKTWALVRKLQPDAVIFSDVGPDVRWVGNESGFAAENSWSTYTPEGPQPGTLPAPGYTNYKLGETGTLGGKYWIPAECDVSIRPGWFWHENENSRVKTPRQLVDLYFRSVGHGGSFLLNVPPDRRGKVHEADVASLKAYGDHIRQTFAKNLALGASITASNVRGGSPTFGTANLLDGKWGTYWATDDTVVKPELTVRLSSSQTFNVVLLRESLPLGHRVTSFAVDVTVDGQWKEIAQRQSIGACRLIRLGNSITTDQVRVRVLSGLAGPALTEFGLYLEPAH